MGEQHMGHVWLFAFLLAIAACGGNSGTGEDVDSGSNTAIDASNGTADAATPDAATLPDARVPDAMVPDAMTPDAMFECSPAQIQCDGLDYQTCVNGFWQTSETCTSWCDTGLGCTTCQPFSSTCSGDDSQTCLPDGSGYTTTTCDPVQGVSCNVGTGTCTGTCAPSILGLENVGCDFYPTVTASLVSTSFAFAVTISNSTANVATVTIDGGVLATPDVFTVPAGGVIVRSLPWVPDLKLCNTAGTFGCTASPAFLPELVTGGAYRLRSNEPVAVYQFSALDYTDGAGTFSYTNDASILFPVNALGNDYVVAAYNFWSSYSHPGLFVVTATEDMTTVTINPKVAMSGNGLNFPANTATPVTMNRGDALQLLATSGDLTGSSVSSDKRVQVIGGHYCTNVPLNVAACDHLEESMLPIAALGQQYAVTAPAVPSIPNGKERVIRIIATEANTTVSYEPAIAGAGTTLAAVGDVIEIARITGDYIINSDKRVLVAQYMEGQAAGGGTGDPALTIAVPTLQYRTNYMFHAPTNYDTNYVNIVAPAGATITLDGMIVSGFTQIGTSAFSSVRVVLGTGTGGDGQHIISGDVAFGITVYGYGQYTSFWYPGGLNLIQ